MDTAWIQVFVLTLSECVAPAGKTVCQEREFELQFLNQADCEFALEQLVTLKSESEKVIVHPDKSSCAPSARQKDIFDSIDAINDAFANQEGWQAPVAEEPRPASVQDAHKDRLAALPACEDAGDVKPCKIGEIIVEGEAQQEVEIWRREP